MNSILTKRTIHGNALQTAMFTGKNHRILPHSTLNEKLNVLASEVPDANPTVDYFCIGISGAADYTGNNGKRLSKPRPKRGRDASPVGMIPFVMRELDNDLPDSERRNYALRTIEEFNGVNYYCYWLKRVPDNTGDIEYRHTVTTDGVTNEIAFEPRASDLSPLPVEVSDEGVVPGTGEELSVSALFNINFDANDVKYALEVARIRFGDIAYAEISEIGIVSGQDMNHTFQPTTGNSYPLLEVRGAQVVMHVSGLWNLQFQSDGFELDIDFGASEPLTVEVTSAT